MSVTTPIVVDLGRTRDELIQQLRSGDGRMVEDVEEVMRLVRLNAGPERRTGPERRNRIFLPIVVVYGRAEDDASPDDSEPNAASPDGT
jgi:hypothetical protein